MGRRRGFLPPPFCQQCGKAPDLGRHLWPGEQWRCAICMEGHLPEKNSLSKSMNQMLDYAEAMKEVFDLEDKGLKAKEPRNRAEWARMMSAEITRQGMARAEQIAQAKGEVPPPPDGKLLYDTMAVPDLIAVDAWKERSQLLLQYGGDVAAMAQDASASIKAENSLEKMMAHELAVAHKLVMELIGRARGGDPDAEIKRLNLATRFMTVFQQGMLTLKKIRQSGQQKITVQYVNISDGGQAVIGDVERNKR